MILFCTYLYVSIFANISSNKKIIVFRNFIIDEFAKYYKDLDFLIHLDGMGN